MTPEFVAQGLAILNRAHANVKDSKVANHIDKLLIPLWYMQLNWSDKYGLSDKDAPALLARFEGVVKTNNIAYVRESGEPNMPAWISEMHTRYSPLPNGVVYSLIKSFGDGKSENCADWRTCGIERNGKILNAIFMHPASEGVSTATYEISLPKAEASEKLAFKFATALTAASTNGVRFSVLINGNEVWGAIQQADKNDVSKSFEEHSIDLSEWAGQSIKLTLQVDALGETANDWANWVEPQIVIQK